MAQRRPQQIISVVGPKLFQPVADLVAKPIARPYQPSDGVGSSFDEVVYSAAIIILLAAAVESIVQRDRYFYLGPDATIKSWSGGAADYAKSVLRYRRHAHLLEFFDVRNSVAHNHLWEIDFTTPSGGGRRHTGSRIVKGTHRLRAVPTSKTQIARTKRLRLNVQPNRVCRTDVAKAFSAILHFSAHISTHGHNPIQYASAGLRLQGRPVLFSDLLPALKGSF